MSAMKMLHLAGLTPVQIQKLDVLGYWSAPASKGHHLAVPGGLVEHSVNVTARLVELSTAWGVKWPRPESPYLVGMLHDLVKTKCYRLMPDCGAKAAYEFLLKENLKHGLSSKFAAECSLGVRFEQAEEDAIVYHMGPWNLGKDYDRDELDRAIRRSGPFIVATYGADWYASAVDEGGEP